MQGENEEFLGLPQKNTSSDSDRMEDSDGRDARDKAAARKERERTPEKPEFKQEPYDLRTRHGKRIPKISTPKGKKGSKKDPLLNPWREKKKRRT